jgi:hypothetical protein
MSSDCPKCQSPKSEKIIHIARGLHKLHPARQETLNPEGDITIKVMSWCPKCQTEPEDQFLDKS